MCGSAACCGEKETRECEKTTDPTETSAPRVEIETSLKTTAANLTTEFNRLVNLSDGPP